MKINGKRTIEKVIGRKKERQQKEEIKISNERGKLRK
jgi:hypothetical protein